MHTASGKHVAKEIRFPDWVSREVAAQASNLDEERAFGQLGPCLARIDLWGTSNQKYLGQTRRVPGIIRAASRYYIFF
jgi:hypothetical protein